MERAEFAAGSIEVRGSGAVHRFLSYLGEVLLGIGPGARAEKESGNWWDRIDPAGRAEESAPVTFGRQTELFDETGQAVYAPSATAEAPAEAAGSRAVPQTIVTVQARARGAARAVATTRAATAVRVASVAKTEAAAKGAVARQLMMSQSISSGREESRWLSVPQRVLLPRYQLFEGSEAVTEEAGGGLKVGPRSAKSQRGHVWFV